jgi:hypothetical protein
VTQLPLQQPLPLQALPSSMQQAPLTQLWPLEQAGAQSAVERHWPPEGAKPLSQAIWQLVPSQVAWPCMGGPGQGVQLAPQVSTLALETHSLTPHSWKPGLHRTPQVPPLHVALPFCGTRHGLHEPQ